MSHSARACLHAPLTLTRLFAALLVPVAAFAACDDAPTIEQLHASTTYPSVTARPDLLTPGDTLVVPDVLPDVVPDAGPEVVPDAGPEVVPDAGPDLGEPDASPTDATGPDTTEPEVIQPEPPDPEPPSGPPITQAALSALSSAIDSARANATLSGHTFGGAIIDLETGESLYGFRADSPMIPASNTKIVTTAAAIALLGEDYRLLTRVYVPAAPDAQGRVTRLSIHSGHDFSWSRWFYTNPREPLDVLAERLFRAGLRRVDGPLEVWGAYCYEGHHFATYDPATHRATAAARFRDALTARGITVTGQTTLNASMALPTDLELARFESHPLHVLLWPINRISHNEMADILLRHIGHALGGESSYAAGARVVLDWLASEGIDTTGMVMNDGSGLATSNRFSARQLALLYRVMARHPAGPAWRTSLTIGGGGGPAATNDAGAVVVTTLTAPYMGTFAYRMTAPDIAGRVFGKSGTNAGITSTGVLVHRHDHREYAFAFLMNGITSGAYPAARTAQDAMVAALGKALRGSVTPPAAPTLLTAQLTASYRVRVTWTPVAEVSGVPGQSGYFVHLSADGRTFLPERRRHTTDTSVELPALEPGEHLHVAVSAVTTAGESPRSSVLSVARGPLGADHVLLVDGNDRWQRQPSNENPMGAPHAFVAREAEALTGVHLDSAANEAVTTAMLARYDIVVLHLGEESATHETFSPEEQVLYADYLASGGALLVTGAEVAWDLDPRGNTSATASDRLFLETWLKTGYGADDANTFVAALDANGPIAAPPAPELERIDFYTPGQMFVAFPEVLVPLGGAVPLLRYHPTNDIAAVAWSGPFKVAHVGFPLASVSDVPRRTRLASRLIDYLRP